MLARVVTLLVGISLLMPVSAFAEKWTTGEKVLLATALTANYIDYRQTIEIVKDNNYYETNPILGRDPSVSRVRNHFALSSLGVYLVADKLENKKWFLVGFIIMESLYIHHNISIGITF